MGTRLSRADAVDLPVAPVLAVNTNEDQVTCAVAPIVSVQTLPPLASKTGKRYYCFTTAAQRQGGPGFVVAGWETSLQFLQGRWCQRGPAPKGFDNLESVINFVLTTCSQHSCTVRALHQLLLLYHSL